MPLEGYHDLRDYNVIMGVRDTDFVFLTDHNDPDIWKRALACYGALMMPAEGLDEHLESTVYTLRFYLDLGGDLKILNNQPALMPPTKVVGEFKGNRPRSDIFVGE